MATRAWTLFGALSVVWGVPYLILVPVALLDSPARVRSAGALASIVVLGLVCTALGFALMAVLVVAPARR
jgi:hypothetical protein